MKQSIRVMFLNEDGKLLTYERGDGHESTIETCGHEDLNFNEDQAKINLYATMEYFEFYNDKKYKVVKRSFMPCTPQCLYLYLKEEK